MNSPHEIQDIVNNYPQLSLSEISSLLIGGLIAIVATLVGVFITTIITSRLGDKKEIKYLKIGFIDEITEIKDIIKSMLETQKIAKLLDKSYLVNLSESMAFFNDKRNKLFYIEDQKIRSDLKKFYTDLEKETKNVIDSSAIGSLKEDDAEQKEEVAKVAKNFNELQTRAKTLIDSIKKYNYKVFGICF